MHPSEHLCKNALRMVILGHKRASKARLKANAPSLRIAETLTNQSFPPKQKGHQPRIEIDVLLWQRLIIVIQGADFQGKSSARVLAVLRGYNRSAQV